ncbi:MAG: hypothetical protein RIR10_2027, partial [Planctomycetota bacterium]
TSSRRRCLRERVCFGSSLCVVFACIAVRCPLRARALVASRPAQWSIGSCARLVPIAGFRIPHVWGHSTQQAAASPAACCVSRPVREGVASANACASAPRFAWSSRASLCAARFEHARSSPRAQPNGLSDPALGWCRSQDFESLMFGVTQRNRPRLRPRHVSL